MPRRANSSPKAAELGQPAASLWPRSGQAERGPPSPAFCSVRPSVGWKMPTLIGTGSALLSPPIHTLISPRITLTDTLN